jgi:tungstate transport system substrate-binding protein
MKSIFRLSIVTLTLLAFFCTGAMAAEILKLSTTTSTANSGLLDYLLPKFEAKYDCKVHVLPMGTGAALKVAEAGDVDVTMVHARSKEDKFVADGYGVNRRDLMYNDFVLVGPANDPAGIKSAKNAAEALAKIAAAKATFISRGDDSGTHSKEQALWGKSGIELEKVTTTITKKGKSREISFQEPAGSKGWYASVGQGMGAVLNMAKEKQAYTLTDRGTYIAYTAEKGFDLPILSEGDKELFNPYGVIAVNPEKHPHVKYELAMSFIDWLTSPEGQQLINDYKKHGKQLFYIYE